MRRSVTMATMVGAMLLGQVPTWGATQNGNYETAYPASSTSGDQIPGNTSTASSSATADRSGAVSAQASASSDSPVGASVFGLNFGGASAIASGNVTHSFPVGAGTYSYSVTFSNIARTVNPSSWQGSDYYGVSQAFEGAGSYAAVYAHFYPCSASQSCIPDYAASTTAGTQGPTGTVVVSGSIVAAGAGRIIIIAGLAAYATVRGAGAAASCTTSGTISSISVS